MGFREIGGESLNITLAELLAERGLRILGGIILLKDSKRSELDVLMGLNGVRNNNEGKKLGAWYDLVRQCEERLDNNVYDLYIMIAYVEVRMNTLFPSQLNVDFNECLSYIMSIYINAIREDVLGSVIEKINGTIDNFAERISLGVNINRSKEVLELREKEKVKDKEGLKCLKKQVKKDFM